MENNTLSAKSDYISKLKTEQIAVECVMDIPEDKPIVEVLGKSASSTYLNAESGENLATVSGKASFKLIYRTEDGAHALDYFSSFSTDIKLNGKNNIDKLKFSGV